MNRIFDKLKKADPMMIGIAMVILAGVIFGLVGCGQSGSRTGGANALANDHYQQSNFQCLNHGTVPGLSGFHRDLAGAWHRHNDNSREGVQSCDAPEPVQPPQQPPPREPAPRRCRTRRPTTSRRPSARSLGACRSPTHTRRSGRRRGRGPRCRPASARPAEP